ncbi:MAG: amylo-alpha-1,6-glucosidase [Phycisphaerales bacterium]
MEIARVATKGCELDDLLAREWLLTNQRGSFASSTIAGCNTSGYHGLLVGSPDPLVSRVMALSNCLETVLWNGQDVELSTCEFQDRFAPSGYRHLYEFSRDTGVRFSFRLTPADLSKAVYLAGDSDTVLVEYTFEEVREPFDLILRPLVALRDFHLHQKSDAPLRQTSLHDGVIVNNELLVGCSLRMGCSQLQYESDPQWWFDFIYRVNRDRGLHHVEDLWAPGIFRGRIETAGRILFWARLGDTVELECMPPIDVAAIKRDLLNRQEKLIRLAGAKEEKDKILCLAADQFVARRAGVEAERTTIVAGFPWFADWGRDTFISLPGLLLATGRHEEAGSVLCTFSAAADGGMIPNRFDDRSGQAHFNSVDASLWFINAAFEYFDATGDAATLKDKLLPAIRSIIDSYQTGTRFGIHADCDGLIMAGDAGTQLTWMDAMCDGIAFTPRHGKAVEINALWHNALRRTQQFCEMQALPGADRYAAMAEQVGRSFGPLFWNPQRGYLNDSVQPDGAIDASLRPNQVFAVSLPFAPPLIQEQRKAVVKVVERELLTPYGLRTLGRRDPFYKGRYGGSPRCRDEAYHQGTVWPFLMGPFVEAYLKTHKFSKRSRQKAAELIQPLLEQLTHDACLGSISEVLDGDPPHRPGGCPAQAWSVAELIRIRRLLAVSR